MKKIIKSKNKKFRNFARLLFVAIAPRSFMLKRRLSNNVIIIGKNRPGHGGRGIFIYGDRLEPELEYLEHFLEYDSVFIDVGANTGIYTLKAAKYLEKGKGCVISIEPSLDSLFNLDKSIRMNNLKNIRLRNFCAGSKNIRRNLWLNRRQPTQFSLIKTDEKASSLSVLTIKLDDLFEWEELRRLDYIKIDVEGTEKDVILGAKKIIKKYRPIIQVEVIHKKNNIEIEDYCTLKSNRKDLNRLYFPLEHKKIKVAQKLGWIKDKK